VALSGKPLFLNEIWQARVLGENTIEILAESGCFFLLEFSEADFFRCHIDMAQTEPLSAVERLLGLDGSGKSWNDPARYPVNDSDLFAFRTASFAPI
jgi:hypothetical protein